MRQKCRDTYDAWCVGKKLIPSRKFMSVWTDGYTIFSYDTPILHFFELKNGPEVYVLNLSEYSTTTSQHQNGLHRLLEEDGGMGDVIVLRDIEQGAEVCDLEGEAYRDWISSQADGP